MENKGVSNLKEAVVAAVDVVMIAKDGKLNAEDMPRMLQLVQDLGPAIDGASEIPSEVSDLDTAEASEIVSAVMAKLQLDNPKAEAIVGKSLKVLAASYDLVKEVRA